MNKQTVGVVLVILLGVQLGLVAYFAGWFDKKPASAEKEEETKKPWELPPAPERRKELPAFFENLAEAHKTGQAEIINAHGDLERWADEVMTVVRREKGEASPTDRRRLLGKLADKVMAQSMLPPWKSVRIDWQSYRELPVAGEAQVNVAHRVADGSDYHMCWWLKYGPTGWRYFDWEDRELNERFSTSASQALKVSPEDLARWGPAGVLLSRGEVVIQRSLGQGAGQLIHTENAATKLAQIATIKFPAVVEAHRWLLSGIVALRQKKPAQALKDFDKAESFRKPIPYTDRLRAQAYLDLGESGRALASLAQYTQTVGEDPLTACSRGVALMRLGQLPRAMSAFRESFEWLQVGEWHLPFADRMPGQDPPRKD
jgi:hypothetical protein